MTKTTLSPSALKTLTAKLKKANDVSAKAYPGDPTERQPVHTVYGGAQLFKSDTTKRLGELALKNLAQHGPDAQSFGAALSIPEALRETVYARVKAKLEREAVEDFRIDFEDGFGIRPDAEEDATAVGAAYQVAKGLADGSLPPFLGIRIKTLSRELHGRALRTLDLFVTTLAQAAGGKLPRPFSITVPKLMNTEQVATVARALDALEARLKLAKGSLSIELMIETPQSIFTPDGGSALRGLVAAAGGRCTGAHFGTYDYTALCNITAAHQHMAHQACDFAKHMMQVSLAQCGVMLSDGATNVMPVGATQTVHRAWKLHYDHVRHSLTNAYYQGWDLHPAQLPTRYAAVFTFFLEGMEPASNRLKNFVEKAAQATLVGDVFDDAATGQGLLNYFLRGLNCGAVTPEEAAATGLTREEFAGRSFLKILDARRTRS